MKKSILIILVALFPSLANAQYPVFKTGSDGYVTINNMQWQRGSVMSQYFYSMGDTTLCILYTNSRTRLIQPAKSNHITNGDTNLPFTSMAALQTWMGLHFEPLTSVNIGMSIGDTVRGATNGKLLYINGGKKLDDTTMVLTVGGQFITSGLPDINHYSTTVTAGYTYCIATSATPLTATVIGCILTGTDLTVTTNDFPLPGVDNIKVSYILIK